MVSRKVNKDLAETRPEELEFNDSPLIFIENVETNEFKEFTLQYFEETYEKTVLEDTGENRERNLLEGNETIGKYSEIPTEVSEHTVVGGFKETRPKCKSQSDGGEDVIITSEKKMKSDGGHGQLSRYNPPERSNLTDDFRFQESLDVSSGSPPNYLPVVSGDAESERLIRSFMQTLSLAVPVGEHPPASLKGNIVEACQVVDSTRAQDTNTDVHPRNASFLRADGFRNVDNGSNSNSGSMKIPLRIYIDTYLRNENSPDEQLNNESNHKAIASGSREIDEFPLQTADYKSDNNSSSKSEIPDANVRKEVTSTFSKPNDIRPPCDKIANIEDTTSLGEHEFTKCGVFNNFMSRPTHGRDRPPRNQLSSQTNYGNAFASQQGVVTCQWNPQPTVSACQLNPQQGISVRQWNPQHAVSTRQLNSQHGVSARQWNPKHGVSARQWNPQHAVSARQWNPQHGVSARQWNPQHAISARQWSPQQGASARQWNPQRAMSTRQWNPQHGVSTCQWNLQHGVSPRHDQWNPQNTASYDAKTNRIFNMVSNDMFKQPQSRMMRNNTVTYTSSSQVYPELEPRNTRILDNVHESPPVLELQSTRSRSLVSNCYENFEHTLVDDLNFTSLKIDVSESTRIGHSIRKQLEKANEDLQSAATGNEKEILDNSGDGRITPACSKNNNEMPANIVDVDDGKTIGNNLHIETQQNKQIKTEKEQGISSRIFSKFIQPNDVTETCAIDLSVKPDVTACFISCKNVPIHETGDTNATNTALTVNKDAAVPPLRDEVHTVEGITTTIARSGSKSPTCSSLEDITDKLMDLITPEQHTHRDLIGLEDKQVTLSIALLENPPNDLVGQRKTTDYVMYLDTEAVSKTQLMGLCVHNFQINTDLRVKERRTYLDQELDDDDIEGKRLYKIEDKVISDKYNKNYVQEITGEEFNLRYLQENGLQYPIIFKEKTGLGLRVPSDNFKVSDVKACVGSRRVLDVMDVNTQKGMEMTMKDWVKYYENTERDRLLNVISLEFSHTKLENYVESPNLVREVDWVDTAWPQHLKDCQTESTNAIDKMKYPKVQKYCLMSVAGCYTDFHIDFGGTSVWYHILHGEKLFWLIPPTPKNLAVYENWVLSGKQGDAFLADAIDDCQRIRLVAGNTFIIPSGWIHAVYTPKDSLVFGGNFLHSFNMVNQLRVSAIEDKTHVPMKFRYPFYTEINWYVLERYVHSLTGVTYLEKPQLNEDMEVITTKIEPTSPELELNKRLAVSLTRIDSSPRRKSSSDDDSTASGPPRSPGQALAHFRSNRKSSSESSNSADMKIGEKMDKVKVPYKSPVKKKTKHVHLTKFELEGLIELVAWVESLPPTKKGIPKDLIDPDTVLTEIKRLIQEHMKDNPELAITGEPVLEWTKATKKLIKLKQKVKTAKLLGTLSTPKVKGAGKNVSGSRHRRVRCKKCEPCTRDDCMECNFCKDMKKYGGPGRAKQSCISRQCLAPMLPNNVSCQICKLDKPLKDHPVTDDDDFSASLMECGICWEIIHPLCLAKKYENLNNEGVINEDLPNSWKCAKCCFDGKEGQLKTRVFKGGWRPNPSGTPPPQVEISGEGNHSPTGIIVTEGKRVTLTQIMDSKPSISPKPSVSPRSPRPLIQDVKVEPMKIEPELVKIEIETKPVKMEQEPLPSPNPSKLSIKTKLKMELTEPAVNNGMNGRAQKTEKMEKNCPKRRQSPGEESAVKKRRVQSQSPVKSSPAKASPGRLPKSSRMASSPAQSSSKARETKLSSGGIKRSPELTTKRTKREGVLDIGSHTSTMYDFDDSEMMDISAPLLDKGKGRGFKGRKFTPLKESNPGFQSSIDTNKTLGFTEGRGTPTKKLNMSDKTGGDQLKKTLLEHIERRKLKVVTQKFVVRPAPISPPEDFFAKTNGGKHPLTRKIWTKIFSFLPSADIARCLSVCRVWNRWCINPELWKKIDLSRKRIIQTHLMGIVRRQPEYLNLSSVTMTQKQIMWLVERLPLLKTLIVSKCSWATISGLCMSACPLIHTLDVGWASGLNDQCFEDLITPPVDRKPAVGNVSRLHRLKWLDLSGTEITDESLNHITVHLPRLQDLNISYCTRVTDKGIQILASCKAATQTTLKSLNVSGCRQLTEASLQAIRNFKNLSDLNILYCKRIPGEIRREFRMKTLSSYKW